MDATRVLFFPLESLGSGANQCVTDGSDRQLSVIILKTSAITEKWVRKRREESQSGAQWPNQGSFRVQATTLPEATGEGGVYRWVGGGNLERCRIRGIPDESMFLWMSAATFYTSPRNGTTDGHKIYTANILMFYSPVWETLCKEWGNTGANFEQSGWKKEMMV